MSKKKKGLAKLGKGIKRVAKAVGKKVLKPLVGAGVGFLTGGPVGAVTGGLAAARGKQTWGQAALRGLGGGLAGGGLAGLAGGLTGSAGLTSAGGWAGGLGGQLGGGIRGLLGGGGPQTAQAQYNPETGQYEMAEGGAGGMDWLQKLGGLTGLGAGLGGLYTGYQQYREGESEADKQARRQMETLRGQLLGQLGVPEEEYRKQIMTEMMGQAEPQFAASMFKRGLAGSTAYGTGLADLARQQYALTEPIMQQRQAGRLGQLDYLGGGLGGFQAQEQQRQQALQQGLTGLGGIGGTLYGGGGGMWQ